MNVFFKNLIDREPAAETRVIGVSLPISSLTMQTIDIMRCMQAHWS